MNGDSQSTGVRHDVNVASLQLLSDLVRVGMTKCEDARDRRLVARRQQLDGKLGDFFKTSQRQWARDLIDGCDADAAQVLKGRSNRIDRGEVWHPHGKTCGSGAADGTLEPVRPERILQVKPATGRHIPIVGPRRRHADQSAAVARENPFVSAADDQISTGQIKRDATDRLRDIDRKQR